MLARWWVQVCLALGLGLVALVSCASAGESARQGRGDAVPVEPTRNALGAERGALDAPTFEDHWHAAYGVYDCQTEAFLDPFMSGADPDGIHSHQDGLVHIHPFTSTVTGTGARLEVFLRNMGATLTDIELSMWGGESLIAGTTCSGQQAILQVVRWDDASSLDSPTEVRIEDLGGFRFLADGEVITIALAPEGAAVPPPPSLDQLPAVLGQSRNEGVDPPTGVLRPEDFGPTPSAGD